VTGARPSRASALPIVSLGSMVPSRTCSPREETIAASRPGELATLESSRMAGVIAAKVDIDAAKAPPTRPAAWAGTEARNGATRMAAAAIAERRAEAPKSHGCTRFVRARTGPVPPTTGRRAFRSLKRPPLAPKLRALRLAHRQRRLPTVCDA